MFYMGNDDQQHRVKKELSMQSATLDSAKNKCRVLVTDGEELKSRYIFFHREKQCSIYFMPNQGQAPGGVAGYITGAQNLKADKTASLTESQKLQT